MKKILIVLACFALVSPAYAKHNKNKSKHKGLPPGLAKKVERGGELPPGWQKKLVRGEVLDEDIYSRGVMLSDEERGGIPPSPAGTSLLRVEDKIIRVMDATRTILDVFDVGGKRYNR